MASAVHRTKTKLHPPIMPWAPSPPSNSPASAYHIHGPPGELADACVSPDIMALALSHSLTWCEELTLQIKCNIFSPSHCTKHETGTQIYKQDDFTQIS